MGGGIDFRYLIAFCYNDRFYWRPEVLIGSALSIVELVSCFLFRVRAVSSYSMLLELFKICSHTTSYLPSTPTKKQKLDKFTNFQLQKCWLKILTSNREYDRLPY